MKIIVFTGSRAEVFLQLPLWNILKHQFNVDIDVCFSYPDEETKTIIEKILNINHFKIIKSISLINLKKEHCYRISKVLSELNNLDLKQFDASIVFADRYESFGFSIATSQIGLPLVHIEAGDITMGGTYDDNVRHAISSLASLFITTNKKASQVLNSNKLGRGRIINCGIFSSLDNNNLKDIDSLKKEFNLDISQKDQKIIIFTYHPLSSDQVNQTKELEQIKIAFEILSKKFNLRILFTGVNSDLGSDHVSLFIKGIKLINSKVSFHSTLGAQNYLSLMNIGNSREVIIMGNSSSIVKEVPFFSCKGLLIGKRQLGRLLGSNTYIADANFADIVEKFQLIIESYWELKKVLNPYLKKNGAKRAAFFIYDKIKNNKKSVINNQYLDI